MSVQLAVLMYLVFYLVYDVHLSVLGEYECVLCFSVCYLSLDTFISVSLCASVLRNTLIRSVYVCVSSDVFVYLYYVNLH